MEADQKFTLRHLLNKDIGRAMELSSSEGWNQTERDWRILIDNPSNICLAALYRGEIIGTATALNHSNEVAWIGMVLVDKRFRGQGAGRILLTEIINVLGEVPSIKLDATPAGEPLYRKMGFTGEYKIRRMENASFHSKSSWSSVLAPVEMRREDLEDVIKLDREMFGTGRRYLLMSLFEACPDKAFIIKRNYKPAAYIFGRDGVKYNYAGPLYAFSDDLAESLLSRSLESIADKPVAIDVPDDKARFIRWLESAGFTGQRHFIRMYLKSNSCSGQVEYQYLISGPEFG